MAIKAKYNGTCKATGKEINPGDWIEHTSVGWVLANDLNRDSFSGAEYVEACGPDPVQDEHGDEYPVWYVIIFGEGDEELKVETVYNRGHAVDRGETLAHLHGVEFVNDAGWS